MILFQIPARYGLLIYDHVHNKVCAVRSRARVWCRELLVRVESSAYRRSIIIYGLVYLQVFSQLVLSVSTAASAKRRDSFVRNMV